MTHNQKRGKSFEQLCVKRAHKIAPSLVVQWVKKDRYTSYQDIEFIDFPIFKVDCKFTIAEFSWTNKKKLYKKVRMLYGDKAIVILGERKGKNRLSFSNDVTVLFKLKGLLVQCKYDDWLRKLEKENTYATSEKRLNQKVKNKKRGTRRR